MNKKAINFNKWIHPKTLKSDYRTPDFVLNYIEKSWNCKITHDGACNAENAVAEPFNLFNTEVLPKKSILFVNPPWDTKSVKIFTEAAVWHYKKSPWSKIVFLLPNKLSEVGWVDEINNRFVKIIMLGGRLNFSGPNSVKQGSSRWGSFLGVIGHNRYNKTYFDSINISKLKEIEKNGKNQ